MTVRDRTVLAIGIGLGVWVVPAATLLGARISHRHFLSIDLEFKETA